MEQHLFPPPEDIGDCYILIGYPHEGASCLAFACHGEDREQPGKWKWCLQADDGDEYECGSCEEAYEHTMADEIRLVRRVREGLVECIINRLKPDIGKQLYYAKSRVVRKKPDRKSELLREIGELIVGKIIREAGGQVTDEETLETVLEIVRQEAMARTVVVFSPLTQIPDVGDLLGGRCGDCGGPLQIVRPGKWQCPRCE